MVKSRVLALCALTCGLSALQTSATPEKVLGYNPNICTIPASSSDNVVILVLQDAADKQKGDFIGNEHSTIVTFDFNKQSTGCIADAQAALSVLQQLHQSGGSNVIIFARSKRGVEAANTMLDMLNNPAKKHYQTSMEKLELTTVNTLELKQSIINIFIEQPTSGAFTSLTQEQAITALKSYISQRYPAPQPQPAPQSSRKRRCRGGCCSCRR
jgi:hypothetical protein